MHAERPEGVLTYYRDLEAVQSAAEFAETVFEDVEDALSRVKSTAEQAWKLLRALNGTEFQGFKFPEVAAAHWKELLQTTIADLATHRQRVIFFWDEVPWMLDRIKDTEGERVAMEVLDTLRSLRQTYPTIRMVFTGSVGLHHVLGSLARKGYANAPINDMETIDVPALADADAEDLARRLLEGEHIVTPDRAAMARSIARVTGNVPFYIHKIVGELKYRADPATGAAIDALVLDALTDSQDRWELSHYRSRIHNYYGQDADLVRHVLDILAVADRPLEFGEIFNQVKAQVATEDADKVRDLLTLLMRDHYLARHTDGRFSFRFPLIRRWWAFDRGLAA